MLPKSSRLLKKKDFEAVSRQGSFFSAGNIALKFRKNGSDQSRIGISVGLKFSKKAVLRNRIRRQLREIIAKEIGNIKGGLDVLIIVAKKEKSEEISVQELSDMLRKALEKGNIII
jgi:ribonuclease P protein component